MEETPLNSFKSFVLMCRKYSEDNNEKSCLAVQRHLDLLKNAFVSDSTLADVNPQDITCAEFLTCLLDLIGHHNHNVTMSRKVVDVLSYLMTRKQIQRILLAQYPVLPSLSICYLKACQQKSESLSVQCYKLLEFVSYNVQINENSAFTSEILEFLISNMIKCPSSTLFEHCICLMRNLSRNKIIQEKIRNMVDFKTMCKLLLRQLPSTNYLIASSSLSILTSLLLCDDQLGQSLFGDKSIHSTFHLVITIFLKSLDQFDTLKSSVDVIVKILKSVTHQEVILKSYVNFREALYHLLKSLSSVKDLKCLYKILEMVIVLWNDNRLQHLLRFCNSDKCNCSSLIHSLCQIVESHANINEIDSPSIFELLNIVCQHAFHDCQINEESLKVILSKPIEIQHSNTVWLLLENNTLQSYLTLINMLAKLNRQDLRQCIASNVYLTKNLLGWFLDQSSLLEDIKLRSSILNCFFLLLSILESIENKDEDSYINDLLKNEKVLPFMAMGLRTGNQDILHMFLRFFPTITQSLETKFVQCMARFNASEEALSNNSSYKSEDNDLVSFKTNKRKASETRYKVEDVIERIDDMKLKDYRLSEIIEVYEAKVNQMKQEQSHFHDVLQSKTNDSQQLEQLNNQYRCSLAQNEAETLKFRNMLKQSVTRYESSEQRLKEIKLQNKQVLSEAEKYQASIKLMERQIEKQNESGDHLNQRLDAMQKRYENAQSEYQVVSEKNIEQQRMAEKFKQRIDELMVQIESLTLEKDCAKKECCEKEAINHELTAKHQALTEEKNTVEGKYEKLNCVSEKMKEEVMRGEIARKKLQQEVNEHEALYKQVAAKVSEHEHEISSLKDQLEKEKEITKMIHKLTGGLKLVS